MTAVIIICVIVFCGGYFLGYVTDKSTSLAVSRYNALLKALSKQGFGIKEKYYETKIVKIKNND